MDNLQFESILSIEEIESNFAEIDLFDNIMEGLNEALAHERGDTIE